MNHPDEIRLRALGVKLDTPIPPRLKREVEARRTDPNSYRDGFIAGWDERRKLERKDRIGMILVAATGWICFTVVFIFAVTRGQ